MPGPVAVANFEGEGLFVVGQQNAVIVEGGDDPLSVAHQRVAQTLLDPFGRFAGSGRTGAARTQDRFGFRNEGLGFGEFFAVRFRVEFFLLSPTSAAGA